MLVSFPLLQQIPEINRIKRKFWFILAHGFEGFSPSLVGPIAFGPVVRQHIMAGGTWQSKIILRTHTLNRRKACLKGERRQVWLEHRSRREVPDGVER
jgi:hypothetical protein